MKKAIAILGTIIISIAVVLSVLTFVYIPIIVSEPQSVEMSSPIFSVQSFEVRDNPVTHIVPLTQGDIVEIRLEEGVGEQISFVLSGNSNKYIQTTTGYSGNFTVPITANYTFTYTKLNPSVYSVTCSIWLTHYWTMTDPILVEKYYPILSIEFLYVGLVASIIGLIILIYGVTSKEKRKQQTLEGFIPNLI